jgi:hypothetical protein
MSVSGSWPPSLAWMRPLNRTFVINFSLPLAVWPLAVCYRFPTFRALFFVSATLVRKSDLLYPLHAVHKFLGCCIKRYTRMNASSDQEVLLGGARLNFWCASSVSESRVSRCENDSNHGPKASRRRDAQGSDASVVQQGPSLHIQISRLQQEPKIQGKLYWST